MHSRVIIKQVHIDLQVWYGNGEFKTPPSLAHSSIISDSVIAVRKLFDFSVHSSVNLSQLRSKLTHCGRVTQICVFNTVKLGTSASSP